MTDDFVTIAGFDQVLREFSSAIYRLTVRKEDDEGEGAGVREPRRPKPLLPAAAIALKVVE